MIKELVRVLQEPKSAIYICTYYILYIIYYILYVIYYILYIIYYILYCIINIYIYIILYYIILYHILYYIIYYIILYITLYYIILYYIYTIYIYYIYTIYIYYVYICIYTIYILCVYIYIMYIYIYTKLQTECVSQNMRRWPSLTLYNVSFQETVWCMTEPLQLRWADRFEWFSIVSKKNVFSRHPGTTLKFRGLEEVVLSICSHQRDLCFQLSLQGGKIGHCDLNKSDYIISHYIISYYITLN